MNENVKYMTVEECKLYRELAAKHDESVLTMSVSLPCFQPHSKVKNSSGNKAKKSNKTPTHLIQHLMNDPA
jgi:hypothetical protein